VLDIKDIDDSLIKFKLTINMEVSMILEKLNVVYEWLFTEEEREPVGFIAVFFMNILLSFTIAIWVKVVL